MRRLCGSRLRGGRGYCRRQAARGRLRCVLHGGGAGSGQHVSEDASHSVSLGKARAAVVWPHRTNARPGGLARTATAVRLPNGRLAPGKAPPERKHLVRLERDAERMIESTMKTLPAIPDKAPSEMTDGELFADNLRASLLFNWEVLKRPINWEDEELLKLKKEIALSTQAAAVRINITRLRPGGDTAIEEILAEVRAAERRGQ
jgi:hypothetical protein